MGLLRKLAELVVEFPDEPEDAGAASAGSGDDVVAAIEKIRLDLERGDTPDFEKAAAEEPAGAAGAADPDPIPAARPVASTPADSATHEDIKLPRVLSIADIYAKAKIVTGEAFDVFKVESMLNDPEITDLDMAMRARMVRMTLKNMGHELEDIIVDAGIRDRVLEDYNEYLQGEVEKVEQRVGEVNAAIQREIDEFIQGHTAVIEQNRAKLDKIRAAYAEFKRSKEAEEQRLFDIAAPFVDQGKNPVNIGDAQ
ncbi:hypothetical protein JW859_11240 [bacterium]|nr:hypothetical protein [bacterium]